MSQSVKPVSLRGMKLRVRKMLVRYSSAVLCLAVGVTAYAAVDALPSVLKEQGWEEISFDGKTRNRYALCGDDCIDIETDNSVSMIGRSVDVDLSQSPFLHWEWKIDNPVVPADLSTKGQDDRALAVYVSFACDSERATLAEKLTRPMIDLIHGSDAPGRVISYVWAGYGQPGDLVESPYFGDANVMVICRTAMAPVGQWIGERFDVVQDHERIFGKPPASIEHVLISSDSDDTGTRLHGQIRGIGFSAQ